MERLEIDEIIDFYEKKVKNLEANIDKRYLEITGMSKEVRKYWRRRQVVQYLKELKEYRQLEEAGMLIKLSAPLNEEESFSLDEKTIWHKLPCKVGDTVWDNDYGRPYAYTITAFSFGECEGYIDGPVTTKEVVFYYKNSNGSITGSFAESEIGKSVFLSKAEAETKLQEVRGGKEQ